MRIKLYETLKNVFSRYRESNKYEIDYENAKMILKNDKNAILVDVRSPQEYKEGHLNSSINLPLYDVEGKFKEVLPNKDNTIIVYCQSGNRSKRAIEILKKENYTNLYNIIGGMDSIKLLN